LACTAFSPDDRKVLYPAFDPQSGAVAVAVYDRKTERSEHLFTVLEPRLAGDPIRRPLSRAVWLPDGRRVLVVQAGADDEKKFSLHVIPLGVKEPVRKIGDIEVEEAAAALQFPPVIAGSKILLTGSPRMLIAVDYNTGEARCDTNLTVYPWPGGQGDRAAALALNDPDRPRQMSFGTLDPRTLAFTPELTTTNEMADGVFPLWDVRGKRIILVVGDETGRRIEAVRDDQVTFTRPLARGDAGLRVGPWLDLGPRGDRVYAAYRSTAAEDEEAEYGVVEIPLNAEPLRWTPLFRAKRGDSEELIYAQASLSHDGRTWAMATAYLYLQNPALKAEDCALFLVEVGRAKPKVTKVPIPPPAERSKLVK
jgi:hypothetical protein